jgi:hypothetical protein
MKYFFILSHHFPYLKENYIILSPCHGRSSGQTQILSSRCVVSRLPESLNSYMLLRSTFLSHPTTFHTCKRVISSYLLATVEVLDRPKSYQIDVLCVDYPSHRTITCGYEVLYYLIPLLYSLVENYIILSPCQSRSSGQTQIPSSRCIMRTLPESSSSYMWLRTTFLSYPTTFLTCRRTTSSCLLCTVEVVDRPKSYQVDVLCVDYPSHRTITCGYKVLFYLIPLLSLLVRELYHLVSLAW